MYNSIACPVDLDHKEQLAKGLAVAADLTNHYGASLTLIGVTMSAPTSVAHNPEEYAEKLETFAKEVGSEYGLNIGTEVVVSHDPTADLEDRISDRADKISADLIVMASHRPGLLDYILSSHAGALANHTSLSVFIVR